MFTVFIVTSIPDSQPNVKELLVYIMSSDGLKKSSSKTTPPSYTTPPLPKEVQCPFRILLDRIRTKDQLDSERISLFST